MTLEEAITRRNSLQNAFDALLLGDRVVEVKFEDHTVSYQQASIKMLESELTKAKSLVSQLSGTKRGRPHLIKHNPGY